MPLYLRYYFWMLTISAIVFTLERLFPRHRDQRILRDDLHQDLFWMVFNMQYVSWMLAIVAVHLAKWLNAALFHAGIPAPEKVRLISHWPLWLQFVVFFLLKDLIEWSIHRTLHLVPWLWRFHQLHHSLEKMDWAAAFRMHWMEVAIYKFVIFIPLIVLGVDDRVVFAILILGTFVQQLAHANMTWDWGPLRYLLNSPRFHAWHHDVELHGKGGQNFGVTLSLWDYLFRTAHSPAPPASPVRYGLFGNQDYPQGIWSRFWHPFMRARSNVQPPKPEPERP